MKIILQVNERTVNVSHSLLFIIKARGLIKIQMKNSEKEKN